MNVHHTISQQQVWVQTAKYPFWEGGQMLIGYSCDGIEAERRGGTR